MVVPCLENSALKYAEVGKQIAARDFCKWLISQSNLCFTYSLYVTWEWCTFL